METAAPSRSTKTGVKTLVINDFPQSEAVFLRHFFVPIIIKPFLRFIKHELYCSAYENLFGEQKTTAYV